MNLLAHIPGTSILYIVVGYAAFGWLLAVNNADPRIWFTTGVLALPISWVLAVVWAAAAFAIYFSKPQMFGLSLSICAVWALLMYVAVLQVQGAADVKARRTYSVRRFFIVAFLTGVGLGLGWVADSTVLAEFGKMLLRRR